MANLKKTSKVIFYFVTPLVALAALSMLQIDCKSGRQSNDLGAYDLLITNAKIVDGTGNPWFRGDVGLRGERIVAIGDLGGAAATKTIDARGGVVCPGFVDMMGTSDWELLVDPRCASKLTQGITLMVSGEGYSIAPINERMLEERQRIFDHFRIKGDWRTLEEFFGRLEANPPAINFATFVGSGGLRDLVIGTENRRATAEELAQMESSVAQAMEQGALGLSSALMYVPDRYNSTEELIAMARVAARYHGIYITHQRSEANAIDQSLEEVFRIAREAQIPTQIYHLKTMYMQNWGKMPKVVERISQAREQGLDITADVYPYIAASAGLVDLLPPWAREGRIDKVLERLRDSAVRERIKQEMAVDTAEWENEYYGAGGANGFVISSVLNPRLKSLEGRRLSDIARERGRDPRDVIMDIILEDRGSPLFISFIMDESDVRLALDQEWSCFCTDSEIAAADGPLSGSHLHPRAYGSMTRILGRYVRQEKLMALEQAIRKATSLPAQVLGIRDRGLLREGFYADLVVFDPETIIDAATFEEPNRYSQGIECVLVNGKLAYEKGAITDARPGKVIRGSGNRSSSR